MTASYNNKQAKFTNAYKIADIKPIAYGVNFCSMFTLSLKRII